MNKFDFKLLQEISLPCYDNGTCFTDRTRLNKIEAIASETHYQYKKSAPLFTLFSKQPIESLGQDIVILSTHVDAVEDITEFYVNDINRRTVHGTLDNTATNAIALSLMIENALSDHVLVAFTANEEEDSLGAIQLIEFLKKINKRAFVIVLDVTYEDFDKADFTIENNFFYEHKIHQTVKELLLTRKIPFRFIPQDPMQIPDYIKFSHLERYSDGGIKEALEDESWAYDELGIECFSLCLPVRGEMHDNCGVDCRKKSFSQYKDTVELFSNSIAEALK